jgi:serine/threonine protein kinase/tetratricopeptide (TPR) repeat protein
MIDDIGDADRPVDPWEAALAAGFGPRSEARWMDAGSLPAGRSRAVASARVSLRAIADSGPPEMLKPLPPDAPGPSLAWGKYHLEGEIARGGMGVVLKGKDTDLGREVAIKVLYQEHRKQSGLLRRFVEEARIGGQLQHPGIVPVYEMHLDGSQPFFSMKLIHGRTLATLLAERSDPSQDRRRFLAIFEQVSQTMAYAHARGVIHRDLKPLNIMVGAFGEVQVVDWGLAKVLAPGEVERSAAGSTAASRPPPGPGTSATTDSLPIAPEDDFASLPGTVLGTPAYMPSEQARGDLARVDERSDVFSLGAILCEILTGTPPYEGLDIAVVLAMASRGRLEEAHHRLAGCGADEELVRLARECLSPERDARPRHAGVIAERMGRHLASLEARALEARIVAAEARVKEEAARRRQRLTLALAGAVLFSLLLGGGGYVWIDKDRAARATRAAREIERALAEAQGWRDQAAAATGGELELWARALDAARKAEALLGSAPVDPELAARVIARLADLTGEDADAHRRSREREADRALAERVENVPVPDDDSLEQASSLPADARRRAGAYAEAFRRRGLDLEHIEPAELSRTIRGSAFGPPLTGAIIDWAFALRVEGEGGDLRFAARLLGIARQADPDPLLGRLIDALLARSSGGESAGDRGTLQELLGGVDLMRLPPPVVILAAKTLWEQGARAEALSVLRGAQRARPDHFGLTLELARVLDLPPAPAFGEAATFYRAALALRPGNLEVLRRLAYDLIQAREIEEASSIVDQLVLDRPGDARLINLHGMAFQGRTLPGMELPAQERKEYLARSVADFQRAISLEPGSPLFRANLANSLCQLSYYDGDSSHLDEALVQCAEAIRLDPRMAIGYKNQGDALRLALRMDDSIQAYREALRIKPEYVEALENLAGTLQDTGSLSEAIGLYREALRLRPGNAHVQLGLGVSLLRVPASVEEALPALREAVEHSPRHSRARHYFGIALEKMGLLDEAIGQYSEAARLSTFFPRSWVDLGRVLRQRGRFPEALEALEAARRLLEGEGKKHLQFDPELGPDLESELAEVRATVDGERRLLMIIGDQVETTDSREAFLAARLASSRRWPAVAARLFTSAFSADPSLAADRRSESLSAAACAAALAGTGRGEAPGELSADQMEDWRRQALTWLRADLEAEERLFQERAGDNFVDAREDFGDSLVRWMHAPDLSGVRDEAPLSSLPSVEREGWRAFWRDVESRIASLSR